MEFGKVHIMLAEDGAYLVEPREIKKSLGSNAVLISDVVTPAPDAGKAWPGGKPKRKTYGIKRVIFNDPATVVYWLDGTKTVVKCQPGDTYSKETGLALCIAKKFLGNKGNFNDVFNQWIPRETEPVKEISVEEMRRRLESYCDGRFDCTGCPLDNEPYTCNFVTTINPMTDDEIRAAHKVVFG